MESAFSQLKDSTWTWRHAFSNRVHEKFGFHYRQIPEHTLWYVVDGALQIRFDDQESKWRSLKKGGLLWTGPMATLSAQLQKGEACYAYSFRFGLSGAFCMSQIMLLEEARWLRHDIAACMEQVLQDQLLHENQMPERFCMRLALIHDEMKAGTGAPYKAKTAHRFGARELMELLRVVRRYNYHCTSNELAEALHLSPDYFARVFTRSYGLSPRAWMVKVRIEEAAFELIHSHASISEIAYRYGYEDPNFFGRQFKQVMGVSPGNYRQNAS